jgi:hypothetical protein
MRFPDSGLKCVVYIGERTSNIFRPRGTGFLVQHKRLWHGPPALDKQHARLKLRVKDELKAMRLSPKVEKVVNGEMKRLLEEHSGAQRTIYNYERSAGRSKNQLLRETGEVQDRGHLRKVNGTRENLLDIAAGIRGAQKQIKEIERRVKATGDELAHSLVIRVAPVERSAK